MSVAPVLPLPAAGAPPTAGGAPPGAPPPGQPFHGALSEEWARTAPAEGHWKEPRDDARAGGSRERSGHHQAEVRGEGAEPALPAVTPAPTAEAAPSGATPSAQAPTLGEVTASLVGSGAPPPRPAEADQSSTHSQTGAQAPDAQAGTSTTNAPRSGAAPLPGGVRSAATAEEQLVTGPHGAAREAGPVAATGLASDVAANGEAQTLLRYTGVAGSPQGANTPPSGLATGQAASQPQPPASQPPAGPASPIASGPPPGVENARLARTSQRPQAGAAAAAQQGATATDARSARAASVAAARFDSPTPQALADAGPLAGTILRAGARASGESDSAGPSEAMPGGGLPAGRAEAPVPTGVATGEPVSPGPLAPAAAAGAPLLTSGVDLQGMIESIHATIELAARQGISQARISLQPAELGEIRIHLSQTGEGLLARVTADTPAAAQALAAGRSDLHHSLSSLGTSLLRLDIGSFGQGEGREGRHADGTAGARSARRGETTEGTESVESPTEAPVASAAYALGTIVDVLA